MSSPTNVVEYIDWKALIHAAKDLPINFPAPKTRVSAHVEPGSLQLTDVNLDFQVRETWKRKRKLETGKVGNLRFVYTVVQKKVL